MLKLYEYNNTDDCIAFLDKASNVKISREINGIYDLSFEMPYCKKSQEVKVNRIIDCEGQLFRIVKVSDNNEGTRKVNVECSHVYIADAQKVHLQYVPDFIGKAPYEVLRYAFDNTVFRLLTDNELDDLGLKRVDADGFLIDFFSMDKTTPFEVVNAVIENCGKGELYIDNYNIALVEQIGRDTKIQLELNRNLQDVTIERDASDLITRLYPYGYEDLHIGNINGGKQYIDSPYISEYGVRAGFKDYNDYKEPEDVLNRALWEFSPENEERIDIPAINITGKLVDISRLGEYSDFMKIKLGDRIVVCDGDTKISERIISMEEYPYEPLMGEVSIGRVKKDLFFYLNQIGKFSKRYKKISTSSGKVNATAISGTISADGISVKSSSGNVSVLTDSITISDKNGKRFSVGVSNGKFEFSVYDANGKALYLTDDIMNIRGNVNADKLKLGGKEFTVQNDELYFNGRKILLN